MNHELLQYFTFEHLPPKLGEASKPFCELALELVKREPGAFREEGSALIRERIDAWLAEPYTNSQASWATAKLRDAASLCNVGYMPHHHQVDAVLQLVLEAKDCAVRAVLYKPAEPAESEAGDARE